MMYLRDTVAAVNMQKRLLVLIDHSEILICISRVQAQRKKERELEDQKMEEQRRQLEENRRQEDVL